MIELVVTRAAKEMVAVPLDRFPFRLGRAGTNDLAVPDPTISRHQCEICVQANALVLEDRSGKGTQVDGKRCRSVEVRAGTRIDLGALVVALRERLEEPRPETTVSGHGTEVLPNQPPPATGLVLVGVVDGRAVRSPLKGSLLSIGSDPGNHLAVKESFVSAFHCRLFKKGEAWFVADLDSTNGTFVNGVKVGEARLDPGATLAVGRLRLTVESDASGEPGTKSAILISEDAAMQPVFELIRRAGPTDETVLITGESGSGKELVAREVHRCSRRAGRLMYPLNCSALTRDLLETELFGHERGAFTGAQGRHAGLFEEADGGTVFLDEIGELPLEMQPKLLRVLENGEVRRVGSNLPIQVDVRVIAATHRSLPKRVRSGYFREDLFYRINVIEIQVPPLRQRPADIPLLARTFLEQATRSTGHRTFSEAAINRLQAYRFPGNVRELKHIVTRAAIMCPADTIDAEHLVFSPPSLADHVAESKVYRKGRSLRETEIEAIRQALAANDGNQKAAAEVLGIARSTLAQKMERYGLTVGGDEASETGKPPEDD